MKKVFAIVALMAAMFVVGNTQAQTIVYIGYAPETFKTIDVYYGSFLEQKNYQGFFMGGAYNLKLPVKGLGVAVGGQFRLNTRSYNTQTLIDVPILVNYAIPVSKSLTVAPFVGPMLSLALSGYTKYNDINYGYSWYGEYGYLKRFNLYGVVGAEASYTNFMLFLGYRFGFINIEKLDDFKTRTNGFFIGLGYTL